MLTRRKQIACKIETVEGVAETLSAEDARLLVYDPKVSYDPPMFVRNPIRPSLSKMGKLCGIKPASSSFRLELGLGLPEQEPEWAKLVMACGFTANDLYSLDIGAVTNGPFQHGETITGAISSATGRVVIKTANGAGFIYFVPLSGTFQNAELITGAVSGASATTESIPHQNGAEIRPISDNVPTLTLGSYEDGVRKLIKGARGKLKINFKAGEPAMLSFEFMGVEAGVSDLAMLSPVSFGNLPKPPVFLNAALSIEDHAAKIGALELDLANTLAARQDVSDEKGILSYLIIDRDPTGSFDPEMVLKATHDFHDKWFNNVEMVLDFTLGSIPGNRFRFYAPKVQYSKVEDEDREGIKIAKCTFDLNGSLDGGDDEITILAF